MQLLVHNLLYFVQKAQRLCRNHDGKNERPRYLIVIYLFIFQKQVNVPCFFLPLKRASGFTASVRTTAVVLSVCDIKID